MIIREALAQVPYKLSHRLIVCVCVRARAYVYTLSAVTIHGSLPHQTALPRSYRPRTV